MRIGDLGTPHDAADASATILGLRRVVVGIGMSSLVWIAANVAFFSLVETPAPATLATLTNLAYVVAITTAFERTLRRHGEAVDAQASRLRLQAHLLDQMHSAVIATDTDARVIHWNPAAERLYGWSAAEALGRPIFELTVPADGQQAAQEIMAETFERTGAWEGEFVVTREDGSTFPAHVANTLVRDLEGRVAGVIGVSSDLSAEVAARTVLTQAGVEKDRFLASVSHELRTPLTAILGFAHELRTGNISGDDLDQYHGIIHEQAVEMSHLIDDLLTIGRLGGDALEVDSRPVPMDAVVRSVLEPLTDGTVSATVSEPTPVALGDDLRIRQILRNLVANALRHGAPPVKVVVRRDGNLVVVEVSDEGAGVHPDVERQMYEPYAHATTPDANAQSIGLGLHLSRELARRMDAHLSHRRDGDRTVFSLSLQAAG